MTQTDMLVTVDPGVEALFRVIQVDKLEAFKADLPVEFPHRPFVDPRGADIIAGGKDMAGVQTDAKPLPVPGMFQNIGKLGKPGA
jgi:hypothetical protein